MDLYKIPHEETSLLYYGCHITVRIWRTAQKQQTITERRWRMLKTVPTNMAMAFSIFSQLFSRSSTSLRTYTNEACLSFLATEEAQQSTAARTGACSGTGQLRLTVSYHPHQSIHRHHITSQSHPPSAAAAATGDSSIAQPSVSCTQHTQYGVAVAAVLKQSVIRRRCRRPPVNPICTSLVRIISLLTAASAAFASLSRTKTVSLSLR